MSVTKSCQAAVSLTGPVSRPGPAVCRRGRRPDHRVFLAVLRTTCSGRPIRFLTRGRRCCLALSTATVH